MYSHAMAGTNDLETAIAFYDSFMQALGHERFFTFDKGAGYGVRDGDQFWVATPYDDNPASVGNGTMIAFIAPDRASVRDAYKAALGHGGSDEGAPGLRSYHENYYGTYVRDPDGNKLCVVCHRSE